MPAADQSQPGSFEREVTHFKDAFKNHQNVTCEFDNLPREEQLKLARELSKAKDLPADFDVKYDNFSVKLEQRNTKETCTVPERKQTAAPSDADPLDTEVNRQYKAMEKEAAPRLEAERQAQYKHDHDPERLAKNIEDAARRDLKGDEGAKLELRRDLEALNKESPEVKQQVLEKLHKDGSALNPTNPVPKAEVHYATDASGKPVTSQPTEIVFSSAYAWKGGDTVPLNKSVQEQAKEAESKYYTETVPRVGITTATPIAMHEQAKADGTLKQEDKFWWERVLPAN